MAPRRDRYLGARADLTALQQSVDFALGLDLRKPVLGHDLRHEIGLAMIAATSCSENLLHLAQISFMTAFFCSVFWGALFEFVAAEFSIFFSDHG